MSTDLPEPRRRPQVASWLRDERERRGTLQASLATRLGVSQQSLSHYENGKVRIPDDIAARVARLWGYSEVDVRRAMGLYVPDEMSGAAPLPAPAGPPPDESLRLPKGVKLSDLDQRDQELLSSIVDAFIDSVRRET